MSSVSPFRSRVRVLSTFFQLVGYTPDHAANGASSSVGGVSASTLLELLVQRIANRSTKSACGRIEGNWRVQTMPLHSTDPRSSIL